jgi:hypothetical protein
MVPLSALLHGMHASARWQMIASLNIGVVAHGTTNDPNDDGGTDPFQVPKAMGIFQVIESTMPHLTVANIVTRIQARMRLSLSSILRLLRADPSPFAVWGWVWVWMRGG